MAVGTSLLIITANSAAGIASHAQDATINWSVTAAFVGTAVAGSLLAGQLGTKLDNTRLQHWFAYLVFVVAAYVLVDTLLLTLRHQHRASTRQHSNKEFTSWTCPSSKPPVSATAAT